jgi:hypothetical protein
MTAYLPSLHNVLGACGLLIVTVALTFLGAPIGKEDRPVEIRLIAGWGAACMAVTVWGVLTDADLRIPLALLGAAAILPAWRSKGRIDPKALGAVGRMLGITAPLWLIMLPVRPSQIDTWLNLLPNAAYLYDFSFFPADTRPESHSLLPGAPYNTQIVAWGASVLSGSFAEGAMSLFNILLQCAAALFIARAVAGTGKPGWWSCAAGFLVAMPLNPGYVPRLFFASYGEGPLAVVTMAAVWYGAALLDELASGIRRPKSAATLALILLAMVNIKQQAIGEVLAVIGTMAALAWAHPSLPKRRAFITLGIAVFPALFLYGIWRFYVLSNFAVGELKPMPVSEWNWTLLPEVFRGIGRAMSEKATFFVMEATVLVVAFRKLRSGAWTRGTLLLGMIAGMVILFDGFLILAYIAHFPPSQAARAHSFFRYSGQLSLAMMLGLTVVARPFAAKLAQRLGDVSRRRLATGTIAVTLILPVLFFNRLRFDLDAPQPDIWRIGTEAAAHIPAGAKLALQIPDDSSDGVGSMLRGVIMFVPPRSPGLDIAIDTTPATGANGLDKALAAGYPRVLISCTPTGLPDNVPQGVAALFEYRERQWHALQRWNYPPSLAHQHFSAMLARGPVCADIDSPDVKSWKPSILGDGHLNEP